MRLANKYRPRRFEDVVGQAESVEVLSAVLSKGWNVNSLMYIGPFGTGKTTLARLTARAMLCERLRQGPTSPEPCGSCDSCEAMDRRNHPDFTEVDAASHGGVAEVRAIREELSYRTSSGRRIVCFDECHMISAAGQNALLTVLEEGSAGVTFMFCTTDPQKMLPTIRSRSIDLKMRLLRFEEVFPRLKSVCAAEGIQAEETALRLVATYCRGHMRDALILLEQLAEVGDVSEEAARTFLRLGKRDDVYKLLTEEDGAERIRTTEDLLCKYSLRELADEIGHVLTDAYKVAAGIEDLPEADVAWLGRVATHVGARRLLPVAERAYLIRDDLPTIQAAMGAITRALDLEGEVAAQAGGAAAGGRVPLDLRKGGA